MNKTKVDIVRGLLIAFASNGQIVDYDQIRRLARLHPTDVGEYLDEARKGLNVGEPDFCAIVVNEDGVPGTGWGNTAHAAQEIVESHKYWHDRRFMNNVAFEKKYGALPEIPGLKED